jgi:transcriptional regulator with GAF, ATPase, and Fis domain
LNEREDDMTEGVQDLTLIGSSSTAQQLSYDIDLAARSDAKVLITGETGVGKDVVARLIHKMSARGRSPLSTINCAGLPDTLLESELFGHVRGSFTGAFRDKAGLLEVADRGTAFLDEAGEMSMRMQGMLLRFLETGEVQRVGCERAARRVNVRVIAATNRDLVQQIASGVFREDLYYRLNVIRIHVRPLRERPDDIPDLFAFFAGLFARQYGVATRVLTPEAERLLMAYRWPGNVRELKNVVERLAVKAPGALVGPQDLPEECLPSDMPAGGVGSPRSATILTFQTAGAHAALTAESNVDRLLRRMIDGGESFWSAVHAPFMDRDLSRDLLRSVVKSGLERTCGNYRVLVELFNMPSDDYKRFLSFLRKHDCQVPFHPFRALRGRGLPELEVDARRQAAV